MRKSLLFMAFLLLSTGITYSQTTTKTPATSGSAIKASTPATTSSRTSGSAIKASTPATSSSLGTTSSTTKSDIQLDHFIIGGGISAGGLLSTNLVGTGGLINAEIDFMVQTNHHRYGIGGNKTVMLSLENLGTVLGTWGKDNANLSKAYFIYEWTLFKRSPLNFAAGLKLGSFTAGNYPDTTKTPFFGSVHCVVEVGHPRLFLYVKPELGYNSYNTGSWKKDIYALVTVGLRWKSKRLDKYEFEQE